MISAFRRAGVTALLCTAALAHSQTAVTTAFEAASVKPARAGARPSRPGLEGGPGTSDPGRIRYSNISLRDLILLAYRVRNFQLSAADAKALDANTFAVQAQLPPDATQTQLRAMLQNLLSERFRLILHREQRVMPGYALVVGKNGTKLKDSALKDSAEKSASNTADTFDPLPPAPPNELEVHGDGYPNVPPREGSWLVALRSGYARTHQLSASMEDLAGILSQQLGKPVTDSTALTGKYEFTLSWLSAIPAAGEGGPDLFAAVQQQLGLKLEASKVPVEVLIIDHFEKDPTEN
jgi:uncharacterized protein (TIGR03435 family)